MSSFQRNTPHSFAKGKAPRRKIKAAKAAYAARKRKTNQTKRIKKVINDQKEIKYCPSVYQYDIYTTYTTLNLAPLVPRQIPGVFNGAGAGAASCLMVQTGENLSETSDGVNTALGAGTASILGMTQMKQGDTSTTIDGVMAIQKSSQLNMRISANYVRNTNQAENMQVPIDFRCLVVSSKPHSDTQSQSLTGGLFRDFQGKPIGLANLGLTVSGLADQYVVNKYQFTTHKDFKFKLNNPFHQSNNNADESFLAGNNYLQPSHPFSRNFKINLPVAKNQKLKFNQSAILGVNNFEPMNRDMNYYVIIIATRPYGASFNNQQDSTSWTYTSSGTSTFKDA